MLSRRRVLVRAVLVSLGVGPVGCGTILHPERKGQPAGPLDWSIVALDTVGLLFFLVPGVIAFAVDFNNGTIYLPPEQRYGKGETSDRQLVSRLVDGDIHDVRTVERTVSDHVGHTVTLDAGRYRTRRMTSIAEFWPTHAEVAGG